MDNIHAVLLAALGGAGLYGGARMLHNTLDKVDGASAPPEQHGVSGDRIVIKMPKKHDPQHPEQIKQAELTGAAVPMTLAALAAGLYGTNKLHDAYKKREATKELEEAHKQYHEFLNKVQTQKVASNTPIVDGICEKLASALEKQGGTVGDMLTGVADWFPSFPHNKTEQGHNIFSQQEVNVPGVDHAINKVKSVGAEKILYPAVAALGTYGAIKFLADRSKRKREEEAAAKGKLPTEIVIDHS